MTVRDLVAYLQGLPQDEDLAKVIEAAVAQQIREHPMTSRDGRTARVIYLIAAAIDGMHEGLIRIAPRD